MKIVAVSSLLIAFFTAGIMAEQSTTTKVAVEEVRTLFNKSGSGRGNALSQEEKVKVLSFINDTVNEADFIVPENRMHGSNRQYEAAIFAAFSLAGDDNAIVTEAAQKIAANETCSPGLRYRALELLKGKDAKLQDLVNGLRPRSNTASGKSIVNKSVLLQAYTYMSSIPREGKTLLLDEISSSTIGVEDLLIGNLTLCDPAPDKVSLWLDIASTRPDKAEIVMRLVRETDPGFTAPFADRIHFMTDEKYGPKVQASAIIALSKLGKDVKIRKVIEVVSKIEDQNVQSMLVKGVRDKATDREKEEIKKHLKNDDVKSLLR